MIPTAIRFLESAVFISLSAWTSCAQDSPTRILFPGNSADPTITEIDGTYFVSVNNVGYVPSMLVFRSKDLKEWKPVSFAGQEPQLFATEITNDGEKLFLYGGRKENLWVRYSESPFESWSEKILMNPIGLHEIDPGHLATSDGRRFIYTNEGRGAEISKDGLSFTSESKKFYNGWPIPDSINVECTCLESPKFFQKDGYYFMVSAEGGTGGPATSHMAIVARAGSPIGPWENSPYNPVIWTRSTSDEWWSKGHATFLEGPDENWFAIYHGYYNNQRSWGRSTLISPIEWTSNGWPVLSNQWPTGWESFQPVIGLDLSDDFEGDKMGLQWQAYEKLELERYSFNVGSLEIAGIDTSVGESNPLTVNPHHRSYIVDTELNIKADVEAGLTFFYSADAYISFGLASDGILYLTHTTWDHSKFPGPITTKVNVKSIHLRIQNSEQDVSFFYSLNGLDWIKIPLSMDISGFQNNIFGGYKSVRPGMYVIGNGSADFKYFNYEELNKK